MTSQFNKIIIGASYFALGCASKRADCLILESSHVVGSDFHICHRPADISGISDTEANTELAEYMKKYGAFADGKLDILKASPIVHEYVFAKKKLCGTENILLDAKLLSVKKAGAGYMVKYISNEGLQTIECERVLDTTPERLTYRAGARCENISLNLFTVSVSDNFEAKLRRACPDCAITDGVNPGEKAVGIPCALNDSLLDASEKVVDIWKRAFPDREERMLFLAKGFDYDCVPVNEAHAPCAWRGQRYTNPLTAFASGLNYEF